MNDLLLPLEMLRRGEAAEIVEVHGEPCWVGRMAELGLRKGVQIRVLQPGSPCVLEVGPSRLSLRCCHDILVRPADGR